MDEQGIGTDATIHEHINTIFLRGYAQKRGIHIVPTQLGRSLVEVYQHLGIDLFEPSLRSKMEQDMKDIADGKRNKKEVLTASISQMLGIYK